MVTSADDYWEMDRLSFKEFDHVTSLLSTLFILTIVVAQIMASVAQTQCDCIKCVMNKSVISTMQIFALL